MSHPHPFHRGSLLPALLLVMTTRLFGAPDAKPVALQDTPKPVQVAVAEQVSDGKLDEIDPVTENGETYFDVTFTNKYGVKRSSSISGDGVLMSTEVAMAETPPAVQKTIREQATGWQLGGIDKSFEGSDVSYDISASKDGKEKNFSVAENGTLSSIEVSLAETPGPVSGTISQQVGAGTINSIDAIYSTEGNTFDVEATGKDGVPRQFTVGFDGKMVSEEVTLDNVKDEARATILAQVGDGKILRIDHSLTERKGKRPYWVEARKDGKPFDFTVSSKGKFEGMDD